MDGSVYETRGRLPAQATTAHRFRFPGNWKIQLENTTDGYHFPVVHKSFLSSVDKQTEEMLNFVDGKGFVEDLGNGHSVMVMIPELIDLEENLDAPVPDRFLELAQALREEGHEEQQVRRIVRAVGGGGFNLNLFPNVACSMAFFRVLQPVSVQETEIHHVVLTMKDGPAIANQARLRMHEHFQGPMGFGTPDDSEAWERVQRGGGAGNDLWIMLNRGLPERRAPPMGCAATSAPKPACVPPISSGKVHDRRKPGQNERTTDLNRRHSLY